MDKTKKFTFLMTFEVIGTKTVEIPASIETIEDAKQWVGDNWDNITLPPDVEWDYVLGTSKPDFEGRAEFEDEVVA